MQDGGNVSVKTTEANIHRSVSENYSGIFLLEAIVLNK